MYLWKLLLWFLLRVTWFTTQFVNLPVTLAKVHADEDAPEPPPPPRPYLYHYPCDQKRTLYMMNYTIAGQGVTNHPDYCSRPFYARRVRSPGFTPPAAATFFAASHKSYRILLLDCGSSREIRDSREVPKKWVSNGNLFLALRGLTSRRVID